MTELKSTKIALTTSLISLLLSCVMLLGTTYAWFIDSIESSHNRILAGNIDIDLLMDKAGNGNYISIADESGDIFAESNGGDDVIWEPDTTKIVYLAVENTGSLALRYDIKLDVAGELAGVLEYAVLESTSSEDITSNGWTSIKNNKKAKTGKLRAGLISVIEDGKLIKENDKNYFAVAVHMPDDTLDLHQGDSIIVDLTLMATQAPYEEDSFGKTYDIGAEYQVNEYDEEVPSEMTVVTIDTIKEFEKFVNAVNEADKYDGVKITNNSDVYVKLATDIDLSDYKDFEGIGDGDKRSFDGVFNGYGHTIKNWTSDNADKRLALFRTTNGADIKNLTIEGFTIGKATDKGDEYAILIGAISDGEVAIDNVTIKNSIITGERIIGVIVGAMSEGHLTIANCSIEDVTVKNAEGYEDVVGVLLGNGYSEGDYDESGFAESNNIITDVKWFNADSQQNDIPHYNYKE